jgi:hypothetical protein
MSRSPLQDDIAVLPQLEQLLITTARRHIGTDAAAPAVISDPHPSRAVANGRSRARMPRRSPLLVAVLVLSAVLLAAAGAAAVLLVSEGSPLSSPHAADLAPWEHPVPGSVALAGLDVPDPEGGAPWDIRIFRSSSGETCTAVGQIFNGKFGVVGLDHVFRALPLAGVDACGVPGIAGPVLAGARQFAGRTAGEARTIVNGIAGAGARSVIAYGLGEERHVALGPQGSFVTAFQGLLSEVKPRIVVVDEAGRSHTISFAASAAFETADPDGGAPWQVSGGAAIGTPGATGDENCASASQEVGPGSSGGPSNEAEAPGICGKLGTGPLFVRFHRFDPGDGENSGNPWGNNPARTLVYGGASLRVTTLTLSGAGHPREIAIDPHGGAFLAVLPGQVDPHALTLTATLKNGRKIRYTRSTALFAEQTGKPIHEGRVEPYQPVIHAGSIFAPLEDPVTGTVVEQLHAEDPAGGPAWTLRSWQGHADPRAKFGEARHPTRFSCWQAGVISAGRFVEPTPGAASIPLSVSTASPGEPGTHCTGSEAPTPENLTPTASAYPADPSAYAPLPVRTVVAGVVEPPATHPMLLGAGPPRRITTDANHAYLLVLPGSYWASALRVSARLPNGHSLISSVESTAPNLQPEVRAPSPDGSAPWGFTKTSLCPTAWSISEIGRVIDDHFAYIIPDTGRVAAGPEGTSTGSTCGTKNARAQEHDEPLGGQELGQPKAPMGITVVHSLPEGAQAPSEAQTETRALPGTTVIGGDAAANVISVTLSTPADVRTVQPTGPSHVFIVVYGGVFYRGTFTATAKLKNGKTVTQLIRGGPYNRYAVPEPAPIPLTAQLHSDERTLRGMAAQLAAVRHAKPTQRAKLLNGVPLPQLLKGLRDIRDTVAAQHERIAYIHRHPGILPPE